ncbi:Ribosomal RNA small subunit methyltransferase C [bioreactor metagenome]|jgi:release factor glutamine methyltransferase|uniref:Ribosomal RNA small subunit methyltransferase C n=1 Tax=bioreactor metagenome TaxID=1076179 RepID=A0A645DYQ0_9ZZZZ|nr:methyltransferase [Candidatus Methanomethylophilaceae archaeon]MDI9378759.1 methyltransferase [Candidatus Thermoplasmatota archaeon]MDD2779118.1 methyltransferase [Candidatus Methanomethylophilaceae archaeon]MDD3128393.1 methyltransferase [Candidatus Methanomethylophilaceae archaeon]MDD4118997.1 methyltransferase [Candidatus Methanomethylophilaceae archaeon]
MRIDERISVETCPEVYPPSEDSYLLIESFDVFRGESVLEVGCGSGIVSMHCASNGALVTAVDINEKAVECARENFRRNGLDANILVSDVCENVKGVFDTFVFNLPYLPVSESGALEASWSGGPDGVGPLPRLIGCAEKHLECGGRIIVVVSSLMDQERLGHLLEGTEVSELGHLDLFFETLRVLEIRP